MSDYRKEVQRILRTARGESDSDVALLAEAIRLADLHQDVPLGFQARIQMIRSAEFSGNHEQVLVAFTWCLAQADKDEHSRAEYEWNLLWYYKWVIHSLCEYAEVSRPQLEKSFADMAQRYERAGYGLGAVHNCRAHSAIRLGDMEALREARQLWLDSPRDGVSDCPACQTDAAVEYDLEVGEFQAAIDRAAPIIKGRQKCAEVPCLTFGHLLLPLLSLGQGTLAEELHRKSVRQTLSNREFLANAGAHSVYLALTGKTAKAIAAFETGMAWTMIVKRTWERMIFLQHAVVLFEQLAAQGNDPVKIKIPPLAPFRQKDDTYRPSDLAHALDQMRRGLVDQFNGRNGNDYMTRRYDNFKKLVAAISE